MQMIPDQIAQAKEAFAEAPDERARMGRISGVLWMFSALVGMVDVFLPGSDHAATPIVLAVGFLIFLYGLGSVTGWIPWEKATMNQLGTGMALTIPVAGAAIYITGGSLSYIEPLLVCALLYAAFFFPERWAWPLSIELIVVAGAPLIYDPDAIDNAFLPRYTALAVGFLAATWVMVGLKKRLVDAERRQRDFANSDPLTGVGNRRFFDTTMKRELERRTRPFGRRGLDSSPLALLIVDLDDFKGVNDRYGHQAGDTVLQEAARHALSVLRSTDTLARIGGDEFAIVAPGAHGEGAARLAESVRAAIALGEAGEDFPTPSASVGWAVFPDDGQDFETLMRSADDRMLRIKRNDPRRDMLQNTG
ncbi:MAG TPA: GGDEF domain-containing protein [Solirubrobacterales bacterium]|nr:GGDEF domain-containing protein [Solirubrobacterales bacterium]